MTGVNRSADGIASLNAAATTDVPRSLLEGVFEMAASRLGMTAVRHRSALLGLKSFDGATLIGEIYSAIKVNYEKSGASANKNRSSQNWRWHFPQPQIGPRNSSPEVVVERAIARASVALGRDDWSNQIPVASGLVQGAGDGRRAVDLARRISERHFQLIELKIASDTPLYAALELVGYACLWLLARADRPCNPSLLLEADRLDLSVLAPRNFYARYSLAELEAAFDMGVRQLGDQHGVLLGFRLDVLDKRIGVDTIPDADLLALVDGSAPLHAA